MSRQAYAEVLTFADEDEFLRGADSAEVSVFDAGTANLADIFEGREGGSPSSNPFIVPATGLALFWADTGDYDIKFHDTKLPARFGDYVIGWQSAPVNVEIDSSELSNKGSHIEWVQEGSGAWLAKIKSGSIGLTELKSALDLPLGSLSSGVQQTLFQSGDIKPSARPTPPTGWLLCNGDSLLRSEYAALFSAIGTTYGAADGTHFNTPDLRGRMPVGPDAGASRISSNNALGQSGGLQTHTLTIAELAVHAHYVSINSNGSGDHQHAYGSYFNGGANSVGSGSYLPSLQTGASYGTTFAGNHAHNSQGWSNNEGSGAAHSIMNPYQVINFFIKT
jgi:microcystin-dependent protein